MKEASLDSILEIVNANIDNVTITTEQADDNLLKLGMDSISFIHIIVALEEAFEIEVPIEKLFITEMDTLNKILDLILSVIVTTATLRENNTFYEI